MEIIKRPYSGVPMNSIPLFFLIYTCATDEAVAALIAFLEVQHKETRIGLPSFHYKKDEIETGYVIRCEHRYGKLIAELEELGVLI